MQQEQFHTMLWLQFFDFHVALMSANPVARCNLLEGLGWKICFLDCSNIVPGMIVFATSLPGVTLPDSQCLQRFGGFGGLQMEGALAWFPAAPEDFLWLSAQGDKDWAHWSCAARVSFDNDLTWG